MDSSRRRSRQEFSAGSTAAKESSPTCRLAVSEARSDCSTAAQNSASAGSDSVCPGIAGSIQNRSRWNG
ncbi:hypothetical protein GCM10027597_46990 [Saccharopolyspora tripterygii]